jgi:PAS domain S-box-containing protein
LNKAGERISGYGRDEVANLHIEDILVEEHRELAAQMVKRKLAHDDPTRYELAFLAKDGHVVPVEVSTRVIYEDGRPVGIQGIARDISERKRNEEERLRFEAQLQHAQKLEGLGVLAGGIAHDFNNLLVGMLGYASLAMLKLPQDSPARAYVEQIEITAKRAAELTNQMLAYSGRGAFTIRPIQLNKLAEELGRLLGASIGKKITLEYSYSPGLPIIQGDPAQLQQVIMNLITNASDAIGDEAGVIRVSTTAVRADRAYLSETYLDEDLAEGVYVCLEVSDTGGGMDRETQAKIFDPFFSTKFAGRGLGLAAVLGIVRGHRGAIKVYSEKGHGATFKILFPAAAFTEETITTAESIIRADRELEAWSASGAILIADDEENARNVAQAALEMHGLKTLAAKDGREALELFQQHRSDIRAVLLDLMMPVMDGEEAFRHITALSPETPIIMSSGYTEQDVVERFTENKPTAFIQKPYTVKELVRKVRRVIEA